ncbi:hypothetical protein SAMN05443572_102148 [Myxococcus fulvus]|uniref:Secreted protein n=1 Tax=Myxococcus fulvus TaxID=33 RepID=A0A511TA39_MYXFU|nr:hypothetical protein [Myxococcus fulvus]GEN11029.1 hypothetical protein MFU01_60660 [Myxococcus fulvus]SET40131.1 hypothetical protein SAMN05443572_102148 [Myxococcus fulvus]
MSPFKTLWCLGLLAGLIWAPVAEARFGKRKTPSDSKSATHDSSADPDTHEASAIGTEDDDDDDGKKPRSRDSFDDDCCSDDEDDVADGIVASLLSGLFEGAARTIANTGTHLSERLDPETSQPLLAGRRHAVPLSFKLSAQRLLMLDDVRGVDLLAGLEGQRFGVETRMMLLNQPTDDGTPGEDDLMLVSAHLTYAFVVRDALRLRAEGGLSTAHAPDITLAGPSVALSFEACLFSPLDFEARAQVTPLPFLQVDATVGLALHLGSLMLRGGWRGLYLDDLGTVDGVSHVDRMHGPYFGGGFTF